MNYNKIDNKNGNISFIKKKRKNAQKRKNISTSTQRERVMRKRCSIMTQSTGKTGHNKTTGKKKVRAVERQ